jgi:hypothetical protein
VVPERLPFKIPAQGETFQLFAKLEVQQLEPGGKVIREIEFSDLGNLNPVAVD